jgi:hypothetical protein
MTYPDLPSKLAAAESMKEAPKRSPLNSVKTLVRESALDLREFNVPQMVEVTGCKPASVQNEIRRMLEDGYILAETSAGPHHRRGKPSSIYRLTENREKLQQLIDEVRSLRPPRKTESRLHSSNFQLARQYLDRAAAASEDERPALLNHAEDLLRVSWAEEGESASVKDAFIQYEQGRLWFLKKNYEQAGPLLKEAAHTFNRHKGYESEYAKALQHLYSNIVEQMAPRTRHGRQASTKEKYKYIPTARRAIANSLQQLTAALKKDEIGSVREFPLGNALVNTLETVADLISPRTQLVDKAWDCLAVRGVSKKIPIKHDPWKRLSHGDYCVVRFERQKAGLIKVIRSARVIGKGRPKEPIDHEIELAVRGPVHPRGLMSAKNLGSKGRRLT